ncbi:MAG: hypothetical protein WA966_00400 [Ornithinimicrobium sp.]
MFFRTKTDVAKDKATKKAKSATDTVAAQGAHLKSGVMTSAASALHSVSDVISPKAAAAAAAAKGGAEQARSVALDRTADARSAAAERTAEARAAALERTADARGIAKEKATHARDSAVSGLDKGIDAAMPALQHGVEGVGDKVDSARDLIVDDLLPKLQEMLVNVQSSKDAALAKQDGATAVITGAPKKESKKGGLLIAFGLLAAIGAGVAYYLSHQKRTTEEDTDPWAGAGATAEPVAATAPKSDAAPVEADATAADTVSAPDATESTVAGSEASTGSDESAESDVEDLPKMVAPEDVPGTDPDAQAGFGTDFTDTDTDDEREGKHRA